MFLHCRMQRVVPLLLLLLVLLLAGPLYSAPKADLWADWLAHDPTSQQVVSHAAWERFLDSYLLINHPSGINLLRYDAVTADDRGMLQRYLQRLQATAVSGLNRDEQLAFWINLYNAYTVHIVLGHYPVVSIRNIAISGAFRIGPWDARLISIEGRSLSLNDIEHRIVRPIWHDNRIHFALNCASISCPNLLPSAFRADNYEEQLEWGARQFLTHRRGVHFDGDTLVLSRIFDWYGSDFGNDRRAILDSIARYVGPDTASRVRRFDGNIRYEYNWMLNEPR